MAPTLVVSESDSLIRNLVRSDMNFVVQANLKMSLWDCLSKSEIPIDKSYFRTKKCTVQPGKQGFVHGRKSELWLK